jgi:CDP-diacylglycerol--glycerol-3-phosphate 3-phosphatidyltransferase
MSLVPSSLRRVFEAILAPVIEALVRAKVSPNVLTTLGTGVIIGSGYAFAVGAAHLGGALFLLSGVFDMLDGRVARSGVGMTPFGAFYDSTLDRVGDAAIFGGILLFFMNGGLPDRWATVGVVTALVALSAALTVSYARARAEGLGLECNVGIAQRAERILGLGVPMLFFGAGPNGFLLFGVVTVLALTSVITVGQRIVHVYRITKGNKRPTQSRWVAQP